MTVEWLVPVAQARSMTLALHALAASTRSNQGCLGCAVSTDFEHQWRVSYVEQWASENDLRRRLDAPSFNQLATLIGTCRVRRGSSSHPAICNAARISPAKSEPP